MRQFYNTPASQTTLRLIILNILHHESQRSYRPSHLLPLKNKTNHKAIVLRISFLQFVDDMLIKGKVNAVQACYKARVPGGCGSQISRQSTHAGGKVVSPTHRPLLPLGNIPGTHFC